MMYLFIDFIFIGFWFIVAGLYYNLHFYTLSLKHDLNCIYRKNQECVNNAKAG